MKLRVGVLAVQGAVSEHLAMLRRAAQAKGLDVEAVPVRTLAEMDAVHGIVLPGGESTTISRLLRSGKMEDALVERARRQELAVMGTCAGLILLSAKATHDGEEKGVHLLGLLDTTVDRNAYGRQRDSFETEVDVEGVGAVPAAFIRAPVVVAAEEPTKVLARQERGIVAVRRGLVLGLAFHPELTADTRLHELFLEMVAEAARAGSA